MGEKIYKIMSSTGAWNIAIGAVALVVGTGIGVGCIVSGAILLKNKAQITF